MEDIFPWPQTEDPGDWVGFIETSVLMDSVHSIVMVTKSHDQSTQGSHFVSSKRFTYTAKFDQYLAKVAFNSFQTASHLSF